MAGYIPDWVPFIGTREKAQNTLEGASDYVSGKSGWLPGDQHMEGYYADEQGLIPDFLTGNRPTGEAVVNAASAGADAATNAGSGVWDYTTHVYPITKGSATGGAAAGDILLSTAAAGAQYDTITMMLEVKKLTGFNTPNYEGNLGNQYALPGRY